MATINTAGKAELQSYIERIERLEEEKAALASDVKDLKAEMKSKGYVMPAINQVLKDRKKEREEVEDLQNMVDVYRNALGMLDGTPLGEASIHRIGKAA